MERHRTNTPAIRIDPDKLRAYRLQRNWTQRELAEKTGFSEDYVSQLERAETTRNKGAKLETIIRFAQALDVFPDNLLAFPSNAGLTGLTRKQLLSYAAILGTVTEEGHDQTAYPSVESISEPLSNLLIPKRPDKAPEELLREASQLLLQGRWIQANEKGLAARVQYSEGSEAWAEITLRYCAQARQQAGDVIGAKAYLQEVEQRYLPGTDRLNLQIVALLHSLHGWLATEQLGLYTSAYDQFTQALQESLRAGDQEIESTAHHFRLRVLSEIAMTEGGAWLRALPTQALSANRLRTLQQALQEDWTTSREHNIHGYNRRFIVNTLLYPGQAQQAIPELLDMGKQTNSEHHTALSLAKWHLSNEAWEQARDLAEQALQGYCRAAYPCGIALAASIRAAALYKLGLRTQAACHLCLDYWVLTLLLHPYDSHPLFRIASFGLEQTVQHTKEQEPSWVSAYFEALDVRRWRKEGVFEALKYVCPEATTVSTTWYLSHLT